MGYGLNFFQVKKKYFEPDQSALSFVNNISQ